jgi:hypothetical protein
MGQWQLTCGLFGILGANVLLFFVNAFARDHGLKKSPWTRSFARERELLRRLAKSDDGKLAKKAHLYLCMEHVAWVVGVVSIFLFFWGAV